MLMTKKSANPWPGKLKALRKRLGLTQAQAAEKAGVATRTWISWENDQRAPGRLTQRLLKVAFPDLF
jgi:DNA-binding XRE family transcriptional regulator